MGGICGKSFARAQLCDGKLVVARERMALSADAYDSAVCQLPVGSTLGSRFLKGEDHLYVSVLQLVFQGVKRDQPQNWQQHGKFLPQLFENRGEKAKL